MAMINRILSTMIGGMFVMSGQAQSLSDVAKNINQVKRDTMYIYAEATMKDLSDAFNGARALLEMKVDDWVRNQYPNESIDVCIVKVKDHLIQLETRRGELYRAFVYVSKSDIMPVTDKKELAIFEVESVGQSLSNEAMTIISVNTPVFDEAVVELTSDEKEMRNVKKFYEIEPFIKNLKNKGHLKEYGKYATMPLNQDCHLFVYDRQGNVLAILRKENTIQYNLNTLKEDNIKNYKNCGAIWFQIK